jgi:branched-chain amino acid transport system substrate-binding protein
MINSPGSHAIDSLIALSKHLKATKIAVIHQGDDYTQNLSDLCNAKMPQAGLQIVTTQVMEKGTPDISAIVTAIRNSGAELIYWGGYFADGGNAIRQLRQGGYTGIIVAGDGSASVELITASGPAGEGVYVTSPPFIQFAEGGENFLKTYVAKYNQQPDAYAPLCYDTIQALKLAIEKAGTIETAKVRDAMQNISYKGLSGLISFAPNRELAQSNFIITQIYNGQYRLYKF